MRSMRALLAAAPRALFGCKGWLETTGLDTPVATTITLAETQVGFGSPGMAARLTAAVKDQRGAAMTGQSISWASSDTAVAKVQDGLVIANGYGSATITATSGWLIATATVMVTGPQIVEILVLLV